MPDESAPLRLWMLTDHKPGHTSQLQGLAQRLQAHTDVDVHWLDAEKLQSQWQDWLLKRWPGPADLPAPDLVIGAGSATHALILLARRVFGCMAVVIMRPAIPLFLYDAAIVPRHDRPPLRDSILTTSGVMNTVTPRPSASPATAHTMLIGGISKHFHWSSAEIVTQIQAIVDANPAVHWTLTNSRRTPDDFGDLLQQKQLAQVTFVPHTETPRGWLATQLGQSSEVWVTPDSVSMVYEAITAGAAVGLFKLDPRAHGRILAGLNDIQAQHLCTPFTRWQTTRHLPVPSARLWEAERAACWLLDRYQDWKRRRLSGRAQ